VTRAATAAVWLTTLAIACASSNRGGEPDAHDDGEPVPDADEATGDGFPRGAIAFFLDTQCPAGWSLFADGVGRTIVPAAGDDTGVMVGDPLSANEQRGHRHDLGLTVDLPSVSYAGVAGEANHGVARSGNVTGATGTDDAVAGPPYAQLLVCEKTASSGTRIAPAGVIAFFAGPSCPAPWIEATELRGRFLVAVPAGGTPGATFGGPPLASGEARAHTHGVTAALTAGSHGIALASGCCASGYGGAGVHAATATAAPAAIDVPYLQLLACSAPPDSGR
jgi:hypothetical protein